MRALRVQPIFGVLLVATATSLSYAECLDTDKARTAYDLGERAIAARNTELAISNFQEANRLCPNPNTQLAIATAYLLAQRAAEARDALDRYIGAAGANTDWCSAINTRRQVTLLEGGPEHLLTVDVTPKSARVFVHEASAAAPTGTPGCQIQPNGGALTVRLPTGSYLVTALLEPQVSKVVPVDLAKPGTIEIAFYPPVAAQPASVTPAVEGAKTPESHVVVDTSTRPSTWTERPEYWLWIGAGVAATASAVTGIWAFSVESDLDRSCGGQHRCPPSAWGDVDKHDTLATLSTVGMIVAAASAATGAGIYLWRQGTTNQHARVHSTLTQSTRTQSTGTQGMMRSVERAGVGAVLKPGYVALDWRF